jgi:hypothetical protein
LDSFQRTLEGAAKEQVQDSYLIAITQQSGAGKTKLCFSFALKTGQMLVIRFIGDEWTDKLPLLEFINRLYDKIKISVNDSHVEQAYDILRHYNTFVSRAIQLFILVHIETVARFQQKGSSFIYSCC